MDYTTQIAHAQSVTREEFISSGGDADLWDAVHRTIKDIARLAGISVSALGRRYAIPRRTILDWSAGVAHMPIYTSLLIQQAEGIYESPYQNRP